MHHIIIVTVHEINRRHQPSSNRIGGVMVSALTSSAVDREFESRLGLFIVPEILLHQEIAMPSFPLVDF
jgi:hypothetical protein